jgi:hypothetical protein
VPSQAVGCPHSLSSSFALCKCLLVWHLGMQLFTYWLLND